MSLMPGLELNQSVLNSLHEQVVIVNRVGTIVCCNELWRRTAEQRGLPPSCVAPGANYLHAIRVILPTDPAMLDAFDGLNQVLERARESFEFEFKCDHGGEVRWYLHNAKGIETPAHHAVMTHCDVTARRLAEQRLESQREEFRRAVRAATLGQLSGALAHELNQPLTAILSNSQVARRLAAEGTARREIAEIFADIEMDARRAGRTIHRLRSLIETREARFEAIDFNALIKDTLALINSHLLLNGVSASYAPVTETHFVDGDAIELQQLLLNLFLNACQAMTTTTPQRRSLQVSCFRLTPLHLRIRVRDNGTGLDPSNCERVFEPFFTTKRQGLGLGLSICRSIVELHGGTIAIGNHEEGGAVVTVDLPLARRDAVAASTAEPKHAAIGGGVK